MNVYLCALCDGHGTLLRLKPSKWYACAACVKRCSGKDQALLAIITRLKKMALDNDQRLNTPAVIAAIQTLSQDLRARIRVVDDRNPTEDGSKATHRVDMRIMHENNKTDV